MAQLRRLSVVLVALVGVVVFGACSDTPTALRASAPAFKYASERTGDYLILGINGILPAGIGERLVAAGSTVVRDYSEVGLIVAHANTSGFAQRAAALAGVESVTEDRMIDFIDPDMSVVDLEGSEALLADALLADALPADALPADALPADALSADALPTETPPPDTPPPESIAGEAEGTLTDQVASVGDNETLYRLQWGPRAINAPEAWNAGYTGRGVRVAILDGGLFATHPDLRPNVDVATSRSFVPGFLFNSDVGTFWHGTHVAGIVGAADNDNGVIGIAPHATLIGVKVLHNNRGTVAQLIAGVMYAATPLSEGGAGAQIINMSVGALLRDTKDKDGKKEVKELTKALDRAMAYAWNRGVTIIAAVGNDTTNLDEEKDAISIPAQSQHVISVGATAPLGWAIGNRDFSRIASYSNWGKSVIDLSAPGGDRALPGSGVCTIPLAAPGTTTTNFCWVFDMYLSTTRTGWGFASGTSMASPVTAGIAALIIEKAGGNISPVQVEAELRRGALDLGKPGNDALYGHGWVNAFSSVK